ncbi:hypothetical protein U1Q18_012802 [Sarracenia purpurea var. burkii]
MPTFVICAAANLNPSNTMKSLFPLVLASLPILSKVTRRRMEVARSTMTETMEVERPAARLPPSRPYAHGVSGYAPRKNTERRQEEARAVVVVARREHLRCLAPRTWADCLPVPLNRLLRFIVPTDLATRFQVGLAAGTMVGIGSSTALMAVLVGSILNPEG